jgi:hypothetical protein
VASSKITIGAQRGSSARTPQSQLAIMEQTTDNFATEVQFAWSSVREGRSRLLRGSPADRRPRERAIRDLNTVLIDLYWKVGEIISRKIEAAEWGDGSHLATV